jgi:hypothetical protein
MRVVSNTSPVSNLAIIARLDLLHRRYGTIYIPSAESAGGCLLRPEIQRLRTEAGFFIDAGIEEFILSQAGE